MVVPLILPPIHIWILALGCQVGGFGLQSGEKKLYMYIWLWNGVLWRFVYKIAENNWVTGGITLVSGGFCTLLITGHGAHFVEMFADFFALHEFSKRKISETPWTGWWYCWWKKSCTSWHGDYPVFYRVSYITGGVGFLPSTVVVICGTCELIVFFSDWLNCFREKKLGTRWGCDWQGRRSCLVNLPPPEIWVS